MNADKESEVTRGPDVHTYIRARVNSSMSRFYWVSRFQTTNIHRIEFGGDPRVASVAFRPVWYARVRACACVGCFFSPYEIRRATQRFFSRPFRAFYERVGPCYWKRREPLTKCTSAKIKSSISREPLFRMSRAPCVAPPPIPTPVARSLSLSVHWSRAKKGNSSSGLALKVVITATRRTTGQFRHCLPKIQRDDSIRTEDRRRFNIRRDCFVFPDKSGNVRTPMRTTCRRTGQFYRARC